MLCYRAAAVTAAALFFSGSAAAQSTCDRSCLEGLLDTYVEAVVAKDPKQLPLARGVRFTENGQRLEVGDGLWHTATGKGGYALKLADVERGQAVLMGTIREGGEPTVLVARLRVANRVGAVNREVTELETLVIRDREVAQRLDEVGTPRSAFKIGRGLIGPVESVLHQAPYGTGSGWSTWEESLSSEPRG